MQRYTCSFQDRCTFQTCIYQNVLQIPFQRWLAMVKRMSLVQVVPTTSAVSTLLLWSLLGEQSYDSSLPSPPYSSGACWVTGEQTCRAMKDYKNIVLQAMIAKCQHVTFLERILKARIEPYLLLTITIYILRTYSINNYFCNCSHKCIYQIVVSKFIQNNLNRTNYYITTIKLYT